MAIARRRESSLENERAESLGWRNEETTGRRDDGNGESATEAEREGEKKRSGEARREQKGRKGEERLP